MLRSSGASAVWMRHGHQPSNIVEPLRSGCVGEATQPSAWATPSRPLVATWRLTSTPAVIPAGPSAVVAFGDLPYPIGRIARADRDLPGGLAPRRQSVTGAGTSCARVDLVRSGSAARARRPSDALPGACVAAHCPCYKTLNEVGITPRVRIEAPPKHGPTPFQLRAGLSALSP